MKKRRWKVSQMGVECTYKNVDSLIEEIRQFNEYGRDRDAFELVIMDMTDEEYEALPEFEGW